MSSNDIRALTFDTGGTILDWHTGFVTALSQAGAKHGLERDWHKIANDLRRKALELMINLGKDAPPTYNFDDAHAMALEALIEEHELSGFTDQDRRAIAYDAAHNFICWPDFPGVLPKLKEKYLCASFTILSFRIIMDTARRNGLSWDAVFSCEAIGKYKILPDPYVKVAQFLQLEPQQICMVACHNFDLDAAKGVGFNTAYVRRPREWGNDAPPDADPNPEHDFIVESFPELAKALKVEL